MALTPRKKFTLQGEIKCALARFKHQYQGAWKFVPDRRIISQLTKLYSEKFLYVKGSKYESLGLQRVELLAYLHSMPRPEIKEQPTGTKLRATPLFFDPAQRSQTFTGSLKKVPVTSFRELHRMYDECEARHKSTENHHPDGIGWNGGIDATIECVLDVFNSLLRTNSVNNAYNKLLNILADDKFQNLDSDGILFAFLHIIIRGVANSARIYASGDWRREEFSQQLLWKYTQDFAEGIPPPTIIAHYRQETYLHIRSITLELARLRITRSKEHHHDYIKLEDKMVYYYSWYWGVYQRFTQQNQKMIDLGLDLNTHPTMFSSIGKSAMEGALSAPEFNEVLALSRQLPVTLHKEIEEVSNKILDRVENISTEKENNMKAMAEEVLIQFKDTTREIVDESLQKVIAKSKEIGVGLSEAFTPMLDMLESFKGMIEGVISQVNSFLKPMTEFSGINITVDSLLSSLKYYVLYINTESTPLKMILILLILNAMGMTTKFYQYIIQFWKWSSHTEIEGEILDAQPTSLLEWIMNAPTNFITLVGGVFASVAKGSSLGMKEFFNLSKFLADKMRNFHFIGAGIAGLGRIFDYAQRFWKWICEWIAVNIFGRTPKRTEMAKRVIKLIVRIKYFSSEAGYNAIRASEGARVQAEKLMAEWLELIAITRDDPDYRTMFIDLDRQSRTVKEISDFVTRFRAVSNFQPTMFHIQLVGRPGIGKSTITKNLVQDLTRSLWPDEQKASFYSLNMNLEYFDGYAGQKIMIADDVYKMNEPKHLTATIGLITNTPVILPMANLADKGVQLTSELFLSTTNTAYPIGKDILCMEAVHRRRHMLVEVTCDERVIDKGAGQFSKALYDQFYTEPLEEMPHLKFGLLKPVPKEFGGASEEVHVSEDEFKQFMEYARLLEEANLKICTAKGNLKPTFYFTADNMPPGITYPASGWSYQQFLANCAVRYRAFRGMEGSYTNRTKYVHVENCLAEIDAILEGERPDTVFRPLKDFFQEIQRPYGTEDIVGQKIADGINIAPELEDVDFDKIVEDIINDPKPTSDYMTIDEENRRRANLLARRGRRFNFGADLPYENRLKVETVEGRSMILLKDFPTTWDVQPSFDSTFWKELVTVAKFNHYQHFMAWFLNCEAFGGLGNENGAMLKAMGKSLFDAVTGSELTTANRTVEFLTSRNLIIPDGLPEAGTDSGLPIGFVQRIKKINGTQWYLDVTDFESSFLKSSIVKMKRGSQAYDIPADIAFWLSCSIKFKMFLHKFNEYTTEQREILVQEANFRNKFFGTYTYAKIAEDCTNIYKKLQYKTLYYITAPVNWLFGRFPAVMTYAVSILALVAIVWVANGIASLFRPRETSKVLHRGPQSSIVYAGRPTAYNMSSVADPLIKRNVKKVIVSDSRCSAQGQALMTEQYILLNKHLTKWLSDEEFTITIFGEGEPATHIIPKKNLYEDEHRDLAVIYSRYIPASRSISHHFMTRSEFEKHEFEKPSAILTRKEEYATLEHFNTVGKCENITFRTSEHTMELAEVVMLAGRTVLGNSGSTVITHTQGQTKIIGIQAWEVDALYAPKIAVQVITQETFAELTQKISEQCGENIIKRLWEPTPDTTINPTGAFELVPQENLVTTDDHVVGDVGRNLIKPSFISSQLTKVGIETKRVPAAMSDRDYRLYHGGKIHPLAHSLGKYYRGEMKPISSNILNRAKHMLIRYISNRLDTEDFSSLSISDTITGTREDGSNPMNLKSSPGIPFIFETRRRKGKKDYMEIGEEGDLIHLDENFINEYFKFEKTLGSGQVPYTRAYDFPKDELRPIDKALGTETTPPKTRSVTCMNVFYILAWRRYTLRFWSAMHRAADGNFTFCPGINPEGPEWNNLYHYLNKHPNAVDFDVSNWDGVYFSQLFYTVLDIIKGIMKIRPASFEDKLLDSIFYDVMNCFIQFENVIYQKSRGLVSGFPGTAEVNTLGHWLLFLCIYLKLTAATIYCTFMAFLLNISVCIYGDDILITFSDEIKDLINGLTLKKGYEDIGYTVTSATKATEVEFSKRLGECKFLKATWRPLIGTYHVRKMDMDIAYDLVHWVRAKDNPREQFYENYIDALHIAFGNGKQAFENFQHAINGVLSKVGEGSVYYDYKDFEYDYFTRYIPEFKSSVKYY
nr:MAG: putative RNA-dependent RNA polymerase [Polycipiviridae sp.]